MTQYVDVTPSSGAIPAARYGSCAALGPDGELWISHGFTEDGGRFSDTRSYDLGAGDWTDRTPAGDAPVERCLHDCFWSGGLDDRFVLYGGQTTGISALGDVWAYDPVGRSWTQGPERGRPTSAVRHGGSRISRPFIFGGGTIDGGFINDSWISIGLSEP